MNAKEKYNTKPIDFTGCHPVIAEHLKRSEAIECLVWDNKGSVKREAWICRYKVRVDFPYRSERDTPWKYAEPIPLKVKRIMPPERAIPVLIAEGWRFTSAGYLTGTGFRLSPEMYAFMGTSLYGEAGRFKWPSCIIEEVEDDE